MTTKVQRLPKDDFAFTTQPEDTHDQSHWRELNNVCANCRDASDLLCSNLRVKQWLLKSHRMIESSMLIFFFFFSYTIGPRYLPKFQSVTKNELALIFFGPLFPRIYGRQLFSLFQVLVEDWRK